MGRSNYENNLILPMLTYENEGANVINSKKKLEQNCAA